MFKFRKLFSLNLILFLFLFFICKASFANDFTKELEIPKYFTGSIDKYGVKMVLKLSKKGITGKYFYDTLGDVLDLQGKITEENNEKRIVLKEFDKKGNQTGLFKGLLTDNNEGILGTWSKPNGLYKTPFKLKFLDIPISKSDVKNKKTKEQLIGKHNTSLQWISWDYFGTIRIVNVDDVLFIFGGQNQKNGSDFLSIEGIITKIDKNEFKFFGEIVTQVSYIANGNTCKQFGERHFAITNGRPFWRMQEMKNQCDDVGDYIDISVRKQ